MQPPPSRPADSREGVKDEEFVTEEGQQGPGERVQPCTQPNGSVGPSKSESEELVDCKGGKSEGGCEISTRTEAGATQEDAEKASATDDGDDNDSDWSLV